MKFEKGNRVCFLFLANNRTRSCLQCIKYTKYTTTHVALATNGDFIFDFAVFRFPPRFSGIYNLMQFIRFAHCEEEKKRTHTQT